MTDTPRDEFKNGRYFGEGEWVTLPITDAGHVLTIEGWFIWMEGNGPLLASEDGSWAIVYDRGGSCAIRIGGVEHVTTVPTETVRDGRWTYVAVAKDGGVVTLRLDATNVDEWTDAPSHAAISGFVALKDAVGFAADIAHYGSRLPDDRMDVRWELGRKRV
jgi:hypothetical protein